MRLEGELDRLYTLRFSEKQRTRRAGLWRVLYDSFFHRYVPAEATIVDLGAGYCDFINAARGSRRIAIDLNQATVRTAAPGVEVYTSALEKIGDLLEKDSVDLAFASNVFEHIRGPDVLLEILAAVRDVLKPGGRLVIMQPNVRVLGCRFWDYFDHTLPLSERGMVEALTVSRFQIDEIRARFLPYTTKSSLPQTPWLVRLYLRLPPAQWIMGKQMLVVARKPVEM